MTWRGSIRVRDCAMEKVMPPEYFTVKAGAVIGIAGGAAAAAILMSGPWPLRMAAGICGGLFAAVGTPIFAPIVEALVTQMYAWSGVSPNKVLAVGDAIAGFTGFILGLTGIDFCRFIIDRTKSGLHKLSLPPWRKKTGE